MLAGEVLGSYLHCQPPNLTGLIDHSCMFGAWQVHDHSRHVEECPNVQAP